MTRSASMAPAIGARTMGNSVLKRSMSRRSGHMVCSFREWGCRGRRCRGARVEISTHDAGELCIHAPPEVPAPLRDRRPDRFDEAKWPRALEKSTQRADGRKREDEQAIAILQRLTEGDRRDREQTK